MPDDERFCFVLSPIGEPLSETRRRADGILDEIIEPALKGFRVKRADHENAPGIITEQIINDTLDADLVVADLTDLNANVVYELAVRHVAGKPFIQIMEQGGKLPFDFEGVNTVYFEADLKGRRQAVKQLKTAAQKALEDPDIGNPIRRAVQRRSLQPVEGSDLAILTNEVQGLQEQMTSLQRRLSRNVPQEPTPGDLVLAGVPYVMPETYSANEVGQTERCTRCERKLTDDDKFTYLNDGTGFALVCLECAVKAGP